jgi:hypothetical protein
MKRAEVSQSTVGRGSGSLYRSFGFSFILSFCGAAEVQAGWSCMKLGKSNCADTFDANNAVPQLSDGDYDKRSSENRDELRQCEKAAAAAYRGELRTARQNIPVLLANVIASIVLVWVIVWGVIGIVRWVKRGFEF